MYHVSPRPYMIGNWKMNGSRAGNRHYTQQLIQFINQCVPQAQVIHCPPYPWLCDAGELAKNTALCIGAQNCHEQPFGAYTGEVSAAMTKEAGCDYVILGHSERRRDAGETGRIVQRKMHTALDAGLIPIICIGETLAEYESGLSAKRITEQLAHIFEDRELSSTILVAYEPVWAIGTGHIPQIDDIDKITATIQLTLSQYHLPDVPILYGGSVKCENCRDILAIPAVSGLLVGGASLDVQEWTDLIDTATTPSAIEDEG